ncbi:MAG TPA: extracellular solute-binding protein, partial [Rhizobiaceae bacterium]|nr:extracellular solute-binding protein [Rhizobiaceae bacterium]
MKALMKSSLAGAMLVSASTLAFADCGIEKGSVRILGNDFPAIQAVAKAAEACASGTVEVKVNLTKDHESLSVAALSANPPEYTTHIIANSSVLPLLNDGLVRPLDDYVAKYGADLNGSQKVMIGGKVMAVAFMANAQHIFYRADILEKAGVAVPKTYEEVVAAAKTIKEKGLMET